MTWSRQLIWVPVVHTQADLGTMSECVKDLYIREVGMERWRRHVAQVHGFWQRIREEFFHLQVDWRKVRLYQDGLPNCGREREIVEAMAKEGSENHRLLLAFMERGATITGTESPALLLEEYEMTRRRLVENGQFGGAPALADLSAEFSAKAEATADKPAFRSSSAPAGGEESNDFEAQAPRQSQGLHSAGPARREPHQTGGAGRRPAAVFRAPVGTGWMLGRRDRYIARRINETLRTGETGIIFLGALHSLEGRVAPDMRVTRIERHFEALCF